MLFEEVRPALKRAIMIKSSKLQVMINLIISVLVPTLMLAACGENYIDKTTNKLLFKGESTN